MPDRNIHPPLEQPVAGLFGWDRAPRPCQFARTNDSLHMSICVPPIPQPKFRGANDPALQPPSRAGYHATISLHANRELRVQHLERHLAGDRELELALIAFPALSRLDSFTSPKSIIRAARRNDDHPEHHELIEGYHLMVAQSIQQSEDLGWWVVTESGARLTIAPSGFLVVRKARLVVSAFFAGIRRTDEAAVRKWKRKREKHVDRSSRTPTDDYFGAVFDPAIDFILRAPTTHCHGRPGEYGALGACELLLDASNIDGWTAACRRVGWAPAEAVR